MYFNSLRALLPVPKFSIVSRLLFSKLIEINALKEFRLDPPVFANASKFNVPLILLSFN